MRRWLSRPRPSSSSSNTYLPWARTRVATWPSTSRSFRSGRGDANRRKIWPASASWSARAALNSASPSGIFERLGLVVAHGTAAQAETAGGAGKACRVERRRQWRLPRIDPIDGLDQQHATAARRNQRLERGDQRAKLVRARRFFFGDEQAERAIALAQIAEQLAAIQHHLRTRRALRTRLGAGPG